MSLPRALTNRTIIGISRHEWLRLDPEFVAVGKRVVVVIGKNDQVNTVDPLHIVSLEEKLAHK